MMQLQKAALPSLASYHNICLPSDNVWQLPEKILQFGTGVLLRGLTDYYINHANNNGFFNGRIVVVKSTGGGHGDEFATQDNLYTHCIKGIAAGELQESYYINAAISRVINANDNWQQVMKCAANPQLQIIISNTTEVGITLLETDRIYALPPQSFPGKLLAFLYARYKAFDGSGESGMIIIPTELIVDNAVRLKDIVVQLAKINQLEDSFIHWLLSANDWCNSLVDRIVPGLLPDNDKQQLAQTFGYTDKLAIMSEPYNLWAIETDKERTQQLLSFRENNDGVIITHNIQKYRELKLRLLNGAHTFGCGLAFLCGFDVVNAAMKNETFNQFFSHLLYQEIIPCIASNHIAEQEANDFAGSVINRFANPFIQHRWITITLQYTNKMKSRCVPLIVKHYQLSSQPPAFMALGFAAYLLFMKAVLIKDNSYYGERNGETYLIQDDEAKRFYNIWSNNEAEEVVAQTLADAVLWGADLTLLPGFKSEVSGFLRQFLSGRTLMELISSITDTK